MNHLNYTVELTSVRSGFHGETFYAQARGGAIPRGEDEPPMVVVTAQPALRSGSDVYFALSEWRTTDMGETWQGPVEHSDTLGRRQEADGVTVAVCDMTPAWHAASRTLLSTGHTVRYRNDDHPLNPSRRETAYSAYDPDSRTWTPWETLQMPHRPDFLNAGAGSTQRLDLEDGTILLPIYYRAVSDDWNGCCDATVLRCSFDGRTLRYLEHGDELSIEQPRGFCEPSLTRFRDRFFLTLRNDERGYVCSGGDRLHFNEPRAWRFDDGSEVGNYNTQQHWVRHPDGLFLVYTRRDLDNDHVFRHRAPLMMAQVDPDRLVLIRDTETELVPERGARLGNFAVCEVNHEQTWVVVAEWMQPVGCEDYGSDNTIWVARIRWKNGR